MPKQKVYISSTFRDLKEYRATLIGLFQNQLKGNFEISNIMERMFDDGNYKPFLNECIEAVEDCDLYILILGNKVGSAPPDSTRTYTEIEFDTAISTQKKIFFLKHSIFNDNEIDDKSKHEEILKKFEGRPSHTFKDNIEFQNKFLLNLYQFLPVQPQNKFNEPATLLSANGPAEPSVFLGREYELSAIREKLNSHGKLMLINAEGGIGKTTLASKYWYESLYDYKYNAWLFCENGIINALKELAPKLNVDLTEKDEDQQIATIKLAISKVHDDFLLILDNANDANEIKIFKQTFEGFHWHVLLTSRCSDILDNNQELQIMHLLPALAKELFKQNYNENTAEFDALIDKILLAIDYHTLLIDVFSKNLRKASKNGLDLSAFLNKLENEGLYLGEDSFNIQTTYTVSVKKEAANTDQVLDILYDFTRLDENERYALVNISLLPAETYDDVFLRDLMVDDVKANRKNYLKTLENLYQNGWLSGTMNEEYRISPVIQLLILNKNESTLEVDSQFLLANLNFVLDIDDNEFGNLSIIEVKSYIKLVDNLTRCLKKYPRFDIASINYKAGIFFDNIGDIVSAKKCFENYINIYLKLLASDPENLQIKNNLALSFVKLGAIYEKKGEIEITLNYYLEYLNIIKEISNISPEYFEDKSSLAILHSNLGDIYSKKGDHANAIKNYLERNRITHGIYKTNPENHNEKNNLAILYSKLGDDYLQKGDYENALISFLERNRIALEILHESPGNLTYKANLAISYERLGIIYEQREDIENTLKNYWEYFKITKEISVISPENLLYKNNLAVSYDKLGDFYIKKRDYSIAYNNYLEEHSIFKEISQLSPENVSFKNGLAISYEKLGVIYELKGDFENALKNYLQRNIISQEIYKSNPENLSYKNDLAISFFKLGGIYEQKKDFESAMKYYLEDFKITKEISNINPENLNFKSNLAISYYRLGIFYSNFDTKMAINYIQNSVNLSKELANQAPNVAMYSSNLKIFKDVLAILIRS